MHRRMAPSLTGQRGSSMTAGAASLATKRPARAAKAALIWTLAFIACHVYWYLGGQVGFGDQPVADALPGWPTSVGGWIFTGVTGGMWVAGLVVPSALAWSWGQRLPRRLLVGLMWAGAVVLLARGGSGWIDDAIRFGGLSDGGLTGLSTKDLLGSADPTTYTKLSTISLDSIFSIGGAFFAYAALLARSSSTDRRHPHPFADHNNRVSPTTNSVM
jgi:hypothetical protein